MGRGLNAGKTCRQIERYQRTPAATTAPGVLPWAMAAADQLARLARQHALTSKLMGVDFVPAFRTTAVEIEESHVVESPARDEPVAQAQSQSGAADSVPPTTRSTKPAVAIEPKPASTGAPEFEPRPVGPRTPEGNTRALEALKARYIADAPHAPFIKTYTNIVFGEGDPCARLMFVGEAPGEEEDKTGRPFVGRSGQLLEKMIIAMGLSRETVYICNVLKVRPPNNATPTVEEVAASEAYLFEQVDIIAPEVIVTLGKPATSCILKLNDPMGSMRGRWHDLPLPTGRVVPVMPTFHPAFLLRSYTDENRAKVWSDLKMVMTRLGMVATA